METAKFGAWHRRSVLAAAVALFGAGLGTPLAAQEVQGQDELAARVEKHQPDRHAFIKDRPILGWRIGEDGTESIPPAIRDHLGSVDQTGYTDAYVAENAGSIVSLQMTSDGPDFYIIGKPVFDENYRTVEISEVREKNARLIERLDTVPEVRALLDTGDPAMVGALKSVPVEMIRLSDIGYATSDAVTIAAPWGEQSKPAGQDAFLVWDTSQDQYYMVNQGEDGNPLGYVSPEK